MDRDRMAAGASSAVETGTEDLKEIRRFIGILATAFKNTLLYPKEHRTRQQSLDTLKSCLDACLVNHGCLAIEVRDNALHHQGERILQGPPRPENIAFLLARDCVQQVEFLEGITLEEISGFLDVLQAHRNRQSESEGDLVTALWARNDRHLRLKHFNLFLEANPLEVFSELKPADPACTEKALQALPTTTTVSSDRADQGAAGGRGSLSSAEISQLQAMVQEEEELRGGREDALDVFLVLLREEEGEEDYSMLLNLLKEDFTDSLKLGEFRFAARLLQACRDVLRSRGSSCPWKPALLERFLWDLNSPVVLGVLEESVPGLDLRDPDRLRGLREFMGLLSPPAVSALAPLLVRVGSGPVREVVSACVKSLAARDIRPLLQPLRGAGGEELIVEIMQLLATLEGQEVQQALFSLLESHSGAVRREAVRALLQRDPRLLERLFVRIDDEDASVRGFLIDYLGRERDTLAERLLLDYLQKGKNRRREPEHLLACHAALGRCGAETCLPYLRARLLGTGWSLGFGGYLGRLGAAEALLELDTEEAGKILKRAARSLLPGIRIPYQKALAAAGSR